MWPFAQTILLICFLVQPQRCLLCYCLFQTQSICIPVYKMGKSFCSVLTTVALLPVLHCSSVPGFWETLCYLEIHRAEPWRRYGKHTKVPADFKCTHQKSSSFPQLFKQFWCESKWKLERWHLGGRLVSTASARTWQNPDSWLWLSQEQQRTSSSNVQNGV